MIQKTVHCREILRRTNIQLQTVSKHPIDIVGVIDLPVGRAGIVTFYVARNINSEVIIGSDALEQGRAGINFCTKTLTWFGATWPLRRLEPGGVAGLGDTLIDTGYPVIDDVIRRHEQDFSSKHDGLGRCELRPIIIETEGRPIYQSPYRIPLLKRKQVDKEIDDMLEQGIIRPSNSPWASPVHLVPKKDGSVRFCVDYRRLNSVTKKDRYPLPLIQDIFDSVGGNTIFSTLDLKAGYWQIPVSPESIEKTAFCCHRGHFEFNVMSFGLCNAPSNFQRTMDYVLSDLIGKTCMCYIDDVIVFSKSPEEHAQHLEEVFQRFRQAGLTLKPSKCSFAQSEVELLGYIVTSEGIRANPAKIAAIAKLATPRNIKEVRSFLGMAGYYRQCIQNYAHVAEPMVKLTRKLEPFTWGHEQQIAFDILKEMLTSNGVMSHPRLDLPYQLHTDASDYATGAILVQTHEDGVEHVIQYVSHQLSGSQLRWSTVEKEAFAVVHGIGKLRPYLYGAQFTVYTDHKPLASLFTKQMLNTKVMRWGVLLAEYGAKIEYRKGAHNIRADMLSRIRCLDNSDISAVEEWVDPAAFPDDDAERNLPILHDGLNLIDISLDQQVEFIDQWSDADNDDSEYTRINGVLYSTRKPCDSAPSYPRLMLPHRFRANIITRAHLEVGHMSTYQTMGRVRESYVGPPCEKISMHN